MEQSKIIKIYWDACVFISYIKKEERSNKFESYGVQDLAGRILNGELLLMTSSLTYAEVLIGADDDGARNKFADLFSKSNVMPPIPTDDKIWMLTNQLRNYYRKLGDDYPTLSLPDAVHIATALIYKAEILYTFDEKCIKNKRRGITSLNGNILDGKYDLKIEKPYKEEYRLF